MSQKNAETQQQEKPGQVVFTVHNIYLKDLSFEVPAAPQIFNEEWQPKLDFDLQIGFETLAQDMYEVVLHITVTVNLPNDKVAFLIEVKQAGAFAAAGFGEAELQHLLSTECPAILFPYVRELVSNMVLRGGFPQLVLPPINFEAMYNQHLKEQTTAAKELATPVQ